VSLLRRRLEGKALSDPEFEVLRAAAEGFSAAETADRLIKSKHTIITQRRSLQAKLGARNLPHAVALAYERRLLSPTLSALHAFARRDEPHHPSTLDPNRIDGQESNSLVSKQ
jgi:DNA-binding CsgD family transcriptional regulator